MIIYLITNVVNGKKYVGKTVKTADQRFKEHLYNARTGGKTYLYKAIRKHDPSNFSVSIIEETDDPDREKYWIREIAPEYNMTAGGDGGDTSSSPNFKASMAKYHGSKPRQSYATYGMLGKPGHKKSLKQNMCPVIFEGIEYESVKAAQIAHPNVSVRKRIDSERYPNCYRLKSKTLRK